MNHRQLKSFKTQSWGKWILAGEHAVLRGSSALVFPTLSRRFKLDFIEQDSPLQLNPKGEVSEDYHRLLNSVLEKACALASLSRSEIRGRLDLESEIPTGGGLGASAALCAAFAKLFVSWSQVSEDRTLEFARQLENIFHGESSGVDVAVALSGEPVIYKRGEKPRPFSPKWQPPLYLTYSGKRGVTSDCVYLVKKQLEENPKLGAEIDQEMALSVQMAIRALENSGEESKKLLVGAMELAQNCFVRWGLVSSECQTTIEKLRKHGASANKITGSGDGGYILSLWFDHQPLITNADLISCF